MSPVPGWYHDPRNPEQVRWWDGSRWTGETRPVPSAQSSPITTTLTNDDTDDDRFERSDIEDYWPGQATTEKPTRTLGIQRLFSRSPWIERGAIVLATVVITLVVGSLIWSHKSTPAPGGAAPASAVADTPQSITQAFIAGMEQKDFAAMCNYVLPSARAGCLTQAKRDTIFAGMMQFRDLKLIHVVTDGDRALALVSGEFCSDVSSSTAGPAQMKCQSIPAPPMPTTIPAFDALYKQATTGSSSQGNTATLPFVKTNGRWYVNMSI